MPARVPVVFSPGGMDSFLEEVAEGRVPLQGPPPADSEVRKKLAAFTQEHGCELADLPEGS